MKLLAWWNEPSEPRQAELLVYVHSRSIGTTQFVIDIGIEKLSGKITRLPTGGGLLHLVKNTTHVGQAKLASGNPEDWLNAVKESYNDFRLARKWE